MTAHGPVAIWVDGQREPRSPPDPAYPNGVDLDMAGDAPDTCTLALAYPAPRCGHHRITCTRCSLTAMVTTAGRRDDPITVRLACRKRDAATPDVNPSAAILAVLTKATHEASMAEAAHRLTHQAAVRAAATRDRARAAATSSAH